MNQWENFVDRYSGRPIVRLLECYVLWVIGKLQSEHEETLLMMTPTLQHLFKRDGEWHEVLAAAVGLDRSIEPRIRELWCQYDLESRYSERKDVADEFAREFVDQFLLGDLSDCTL